MRKWAILCISAAMAILVEPSSTCGQRLVQCTSPNAEEALARFEVKPDSKGEFARMEQAPHSVNRTGRHVLLVHWQQGTREFKDQAPYMEGTIDGLYWTYCGFSRQAGVHVIQKNGPEALTGLLVDERNGSILPGGFSVSFSPDFQKYFAREQMDGADLETIKVFTRMGKLLWSGPAGLLTNDGKSEISEFENIRWDDHGRLIAISTNYENHIQQTLSLETSANGSSQWVPANP